MARAGMMQAEVIVNNILELIQRGENARLQKYEPNMFEGVLGLTLGLVSTMLCYRCLCVVVVRFTDIRGGVG